MKKKVSPKKIVLIGKLMRLFGFLGLVGFLAWGIFLISQQGGTDWKLIVLGIIVVISFVLLALGDYLIRIGTRKGIEAQIRRRNDEK